MKNWYILRGYLGGDVEVSPGIYVYKQFPIHSFKGDDVVVYTNDKGQKITFTMDQKTKDSYFLNRTP
jgi:hypothetical protein